MGIPAPRCFVAVVILNGRGLAEAHAMSASTRGPMLGSVGLGVALLQLQAAGDDEGSGFVFRPSMLLGLGGVEGEKRGEEEEEEATRELASYMVHLRDRVAKALLSAVLAMQAPNS